MRLLQYPILAFVPVVSAAAPPPVYVQADNCEPIHVQHFQYQSEASPVLVPSAAPEDVTIDKWHKATSEPLRTQRLVQDTNGSFVVVVAAQVSAVYVNSQPTEPISIQSFQYDDLAWPVFVPVGAPETLTVDKWQSAWPQPYFKAKRLIQYGVNCAITGQADDGLVPVYWMPPTNRPYPYKRQAAREGYSVTPRLHEVPPPESITLDKWAQQTNRPRFDLKRQQSIYPYRVSDQMFNVPVPPAATGVWIGSQSTEPIGSVSFQYESEVSPVLVTVTPPETITFDKWAQQTQIPRFELKRNQRLYPVLVSDYLAQIPGAEIIRIDKWAQPQSQPRAWKRLPNTQWIVSEPLPRPAVEKLGWLPLQQIPRQDLKRLQYLYPNLFFVRLVLPLSSEPAVWQNLASVTLNLVDLASVTFLLEHTGDPGDIMYQDTETVTFITQVTGTGDVMYEDTDTASINHTDTDAV